jgi:hypothetical protein
MAFAFPPFFGAARALQPNFEALLFQEARQVGVETLFSECEQRTG